eukprot:g7597.t1
MFGPKFGADSGRVAEIQKANRWSWLSIPRFLTRKKASSDNADASVSHSGLSPGPARLPTYHTGEGTVPSHSCNPPYHVNPLAPLEGEDGTTPHPLLASVSNMVWTEYVGPHHQGKRSAVLAMADRLNAEDPETWLDKRRKDGLKTHLFFLEYGVLSQSRLPASLRNGFLSYLCSLKTRYEGHLVAVAVGTHKAMNICTDQGICPFRPCDAVYAHPFSVSEVQSLIHMGVDDGQMPEAALSLSLDIHTYCAGHRRSVSMFLEELRKQYSIIVSLGETKIKKIHWEACQERVLRLLYPSWESRISGLSKRLESLAKGGADFQKGRDVPVSYDSRDVTSVVAGVAAAGTYPRRLGYNMETDVLQCLANEGLLTCTDPSRPYEAVYSVTSPLYASILRSVVVSRVRTDYGIGDARLLNFRSLLKYMPGHARIPNVPQTLMSCLGLLRARDIQIAASGTDDPFTTHIYAMLRLASRSVIYIVTFNPGVPRTHNGVCGDILLHRGRWITMEEYRAKRQKESNSDDWDEVPPRYALAVVCHRPAAIVAHHYMRLL